MNMRNTFFYSTMRMPPVYLIYKPPVLIYPCLFNSMSLIRNLQIYFRSGRILRHTGMSFISLIYSCNYFAGNTIAGDDCLTDLPILIIRETSFGQILPLSSHSYIES